MTNLPNNNERPMACPRCKGKPLRFRVRSDLMDIEVCESCGLTAANLGLEVTKLTESGAPNQGAAGSSAVFGSNR
jgi:hypothetical protein